jgi:formate-dependent nitrite reductase membrane component NrfD
MPGRSFTISIPILMMGPYLRPVLYWTAGISAGIGVVIFCLAAAVRKKHDPEELVKSSVYWFVFALSVGAMTLFLHVMGMP